MHGDGDLRGATLVFSKAQSIANDLLIPPDGIVTVAGSGSEPGGARMPIVPDDVRTLFSKRTLAGEAFHGMQRFQNLPAPSRDGKVFGSYGVIC